MADAVYVSKGTVPGMLYQMLEGPVLVSGDDYSPRVTGDLYRVSPDHLKKLEELDELGPEAKEGSRIVRCRVEVQCSYNPELSWTAWTWEWNGVMEREQRIQSGDWFQEDRSSLREKLQRHPWFLLIGLTCLVSPPFWIVAASLANYFGSPMHRLIRDAMLLGAAISPFAAVYSLWLAKRRGEGAGLFGCVYVLAMLACVLVIVVAVLVVAGYIRG